MMNEFVGQPLRVFIYSDEQLEILMKTLSSYEVTLHIDSTGTIIRRPDYCSKKVFYYAAVINTGFNNRICPILEMISCDHDAATIGSWLAAFKAYLIKKTN